jgi:hypothetical protein
LLCTAIPITGLTVRAAPEELVCWSVALPNLAVCVEAAD